MGNTPQRPTRGEEIPRDIPHTATQEALKEVNEQGREDDTDTSKGRDRGPGDPISPSPDANDDAIEGSRPK